MASCSWPRLYVDRLLRVSDRLPPSLLELGSALKARTSAVTLLYAPLAVSLAVLVCCVLLGVSVRAAESTEAKPAAAELKPDWQSQGWPLVQKFCVDCHNQDLAEAELDLTPFADPKHATEHGAAWNRVLAMVRFGAMPPEDAALPTDEERKLLTQSIDQALYSATCDLRPKAGRVTARRLNRTEYRHSIRDLFGIDYNVNDSFPTDDVGGGLTTMPTCCRCLRCCWKSTSMRPRHRQPRDS